MNNKDNKAIDCEIVCDLLPLYHDGVVGAVTAVAIDEHLSNCVKCKKEYELLSAEIPTENEASTLESFNKMMKKSRLRHRLLTAFACIVTCLVLAASYYVLTEVPLVDVTDVEVHRIYRYKSGKEEKFFIIDSTRFSGGTEWQSTVTEKGNKTVYTVSLKKPVVSFGESERYVDCSTIDATRLIDRNKLVISDCDELIYCGETVWTKDNNSDKSIPDYVYAFDEYEKGNQDEFGDSDSISWMTGIDAENIESEKNYVGIQYPDFRTVRWSLDGDLIFDSAKTEK